MDEHPREQALFAFMVVILIGLMTNIYNLNLQQVQREEAEAKQAKVEKLLLKKMCAVNCRRGLCDSLPG